jgi:hypothetical protein
MPFLCIFFQNNLSCAPALHSLYMLSSFDQYVCTQ